MGLINSRIIQCSIYMAAALAMKADAATLKPETVAAWNRYIQSADAKLQERICPGASFLWALENSDRAARVRGGEIVVAAAPGQSPRKVPGGLIHHWMGAVFVPGAKLDAIVEVTRDYDHYKDLYHPYVIQSRELARGSSDDQVSMMLMNKAMFLSTVLDVDYHVKNVRVDARRFYSVSTTTRVQEIEDYGGPDERRIGEGEGGGHIWKIRSIARLEERDGGVYVEFEVIALSRDIPVALRFVADPIVRRVSRNSLLTVLEQTQNAVSAKCAKRSTFAMSNAAR